MSEGPVVVTSIPEPAVRLHAGEAAAVRQALADSPYRPLHQVEVNAHEGRIVLRGVVSSYYLKQLAQTAALKSAGRATIWNCLDVMM